MATCFAYGQTGSGKTHVSDPPSNPRIGFESFINGGRQSFSVRVL